MYVLAYFRTEAEAMHLAISEDAKNWEPLNDNEPVLTGTVGAQTLRDPFVMCDQEGTYHLLSTDGWRSQHIVHAESPDLLEWSEQELIPVMTDVEGTINSWAPECFYDREEDLYRLVWSSTVLEDDVDPADVEVTSELWDHRIWSATTEDFEEFTPSAVFFDPGYSVIDATVAYHDGTYHMVFKDERGSNDLDTEFKALRTATAENGGGPFENVSDFVSPAPVEGPAVFEHDEEWYLLYDHFVEGHWGASRSADFEDWDVITDQMAFPPGPRHGSVLEVEDELGERLRERL